MAGCRGGREGGLSLGTKRPLIQRLWGRGGQASEVLLARAKSFCGLGINDNVAPFVPTGY